MMNEHHLSVKSSNQFNTKKKGSVMIKITLIETIEILNKKTGYYEKWERVIGSYYVLLIDDLYLFILDYPKLLN